MGKGWDWNGVTGDPNDPGGTVTSNPRNLWILVRKQLANGKTFICPSDNDAGDPFEPTDVERVFDFQNRSQLSYSFQYQGPALDDSLNVRPGWSTSLRDDPRLVILADKSPMLETGSPTVVDASNGCIFNLPAPGDVFVDVLDNATVSVNNQKFEYTLDPAENIEVINSQNHRGEGQNVLRLDGSAFWAGNPWVGASNDLIWTVQDAADIGNADEQTSLVARAIGRYGVAEEPMLQDWVREPRFNKRRFPDSFLVP